MFRENQIIMEQIHITQLSPEDFRDLFEEITRQLLNELARDPPDQLLSRQELSKKLGISLPTLRHYTTENLIKSRRIGNRVFYRWSDVLESAILVKYNKSDK